MQDQTFLYRADEHLEAFPFNEDGDAMPFTPQVRVALRAYRIIRHTPCGARIDLGLGHTKFVNLNARKRWACPTKEEAIKSFLARKRRQAAILAHQLKRVDEAIKRGEAALVDDHTSMRALREEDLSQLADDERSEHDYAPGGPGTA